MKQRPIPAGYITAAVLYFAMLIWWQWEELNGTGQPQEAALFGIGLAVVYLLYLLACFMVEMPESLKTVPVVGRYGKMLGWLALIGIGTWYSRPEAWGGYDPAVGFIFVGVYILGFGAAATITCFLYEGDKSSRLYALHRFVDVYPTIEKPDHHVRFRDKITTTFLVLCIYFAMTNVLLFGLSGQALDLFSGFRSIMAGASGSIMHLGIGPIVTGSIIMQLFAGAKIIRLDLTNSEDKAMYQGVQKLLVLIMIPIESIPQTYGFLDPAEFLIDSYGLGWANAVIVAQLFAGSYLVFLLDELVSKWGIGSGISLFIAAGVAQSTFVGSSPGCPRPQACLTPFRTPCRDAADDLLHVPRIDQSTDGLDERFRDHSFDTRQPCGGLVFVGGGVPGCRLRRIQSARTAADARKGAWSPWKVPDPFGLRLKHPRDFDGRSVGEHQHVYPAFLEPPCALQNPLPWA